METVRPASQRAATALLDGHADASQAMPVVLEAITALLHRKLAPWIGLDGCTRLIHRGMLIAAREHPALRGNTIRETAPHNTCVERLAEASPAAGRAAVEAFLAIALHDLGALIGDAVALRIVLPESQHLWSVEEPTDGEDE